MQCPKCSTEQPDSNVECAGCGIVFARWKATQERPRPEAEVVRPLPPVIEPEPGERTIPRWVLAVAVVLLVFIGMKWTSARRAERAREKPQTLDAMLNDINQKGIAHQQALADDGARMQRGEPPSRPDWRKRWDWAVSSETKPIESGLAGLINREARDKPKTTRARIGIPMLYGEDVFYKALEEQGPISFESNEWGTTVPVLTPEGRNRAEANWKVTASTETTSEWEIPIAVAEVIEVGNEVRDGDVTSLPVGFRWKPTPEGKRLGFRVAGPFGAVVDLTKSEYGLLVSWHDSTSMHPAGGPYTLPRNR